MFLGRNAEWTTEFSIFGPERKCASLARLSPNSTITECAVKRPADKYSSVFESVNKCGSITASQFHTKFQVGVWSKSG